MIRKRILFSLLILFSWTFAAQGNEIDWMIRYMSTIKREFDRGNLDKAEALARQAIEEKSALGWTFFGVTLANILYEKEDYDEALVALDRSGDKDAKALFLRGQVYTRLGKIELATLAFKEAATLGPSKWEHHAHLGLSLYNEGKFKEAAHAFKRSIELSPGRSWVHWKLSQAYYLLEDYRNAIEVLEDYRQLEPDNPNAYVTLGQLYRMTGQLENATKSYRLGHDLFPSHEAIAHGFYETEDILLRRRADFECSSNQEAKRQIRKITEEHRYRNSVVRIMAKFRGGEFKLGSGWIFWHSKGKKRIITTRHIVRSPRDAEPESISVMFFAEDGKHLCENGEVTRISSDSEVDLAIIEVRGEAMGNSVLLLEVRDRLEGQRFFTVGHPRHGLEWTQETGVFRAHGETLWATLDGAVFASGFSGGPLISDSGKVLGVLSAIPESQQSEGTPFWIRASVIREFIRD